MKKCLFCGSQVHVDKITGKLYSKCLYHLFKSREWQRNYYRKHREKMLLKKRLETKRARAEHRCQHCFNILQPHEGDVLCISCRELTQIRSS